MRLPALDGHAAMRPDSNTESNIYVNSEHCWHFSITEGQYRLAWRKRHQMSQLETSIPSLTGRSSKVRHVIGAACVGLVYFGIVATFVSVSFVVWLISLVIW
jgi:hypothetical protein